MNSLRLAPSSKNRACTSSPKRKCWGYRPDILIDQLHINREQIKPEARIMADLGADSLDMVEIAMKAQEEFNLALPDDEAEKIVTVDDLYKAVGTLLGRAR
jgi:acyl carrier protein